MREALVLGGLFAGAKNPIGVMRAGAQRLVLGGPFAGAKFQFWVMREA